MPLLSGAPLALPLGVDPAGFADQIVVQAPGNHAGNTDVTRKTGQGYAEVYLAVNFVLTTNATVANRIPLVQYQDQDGSTFLQIPQAQATVASSTNVGCNWQLAASSAYQTAGGVFDITFLAPLVMLPGYVLDIHITAGQAGDTYSAISYVVAQFAIGSAADQAAQEAPQAGAPIPPELLGPPVAV